MRYVYAHFPINVNLDKNAETGNWEVEIRYVPMDEHRPDWTCWERKGAVGDSREGGAMSNLQRG